MSRRTRGLRRPQKHMDPISLGSEAQDQGDARNHGLSICEILAFMWSFGCPYKPLPFCAAFCFVVSAALLPLQRLAPMPSGANLPVWHTWDALGTAEYFSYRKLFRRPRGVRCHPPPTRSHEFVGYLFEIHTGLHKEPTASWLWLVMASLRECSQGPMSSKLGRSWLRTYPGPT